MVCAFASGVFTIKCLADYFLFRKIWVHMLTDLTLLSSNSVFHRITSFCKTVYGSTMSSYWATILIFSGDHCGVYAMWQWGFSFPWGWVPSKLQGSSCMFASRYSSCWLCLCWLLSFFFLCFQIIRVLQCNEKMLLGSQWILWKYQRERVSIYIWNKHKLLLDRDFGSSCNLSAIRSNRKPYGW